MPLWLPTATFVAILFVADQKIVSLDRTFPSA